MCSERKHFMWIGHNFSLQHHSTGDGDGRPSCPYTDSWSDDLSTSCAKTERTPADLLEYCCVAFSEATCLHAHLQNRVMYKHFFQHTQDRQLVDHEDIFAVFNKMYTEQSFFSIIDTGKRPDKHQMLWDVVRIIFIYFSTDVTSKTNKHNTT